MAKAKKTIKRIKRIKFKKAPSLTFLAGVFLLIISVFYQIYRKQQLSTKKPTLLSAPESLSIPSLGLDEIEVFEGGVKEGHWLLSDQGLLWLPTSGLPDEGYNTIIYGHKKPHLFAKLKEIEIYDQIILNNQAGEEFYYQVFEKKDFSPQDLEALESTVPNTLTLFTCDGPLDQKRLVVKAKLEETISE